MNARLLPPEMDRRIIIEDGKITLSLVTRLQCRFARLYICHYQSYSVAARRQGLKRIENESRLSFGRLCTPTRNSHQRGQL